MAQQQTAAQAAAQKNATNANFMAYSFAQRAKMFAQSDNTYQASKNINFVAPIISNAYAQKIVLKHNLKITVSGNVKPSASFPASLVQRLVVEYGNKTVDIHPFIARIQEELEGRNTVSSIKAQTREDSSEAIDALLNTVPTTFATGVEQTVRFNTSIDLNMLNEQSVLGLLPIFTSGTKVQVKATLPTRLVAKNEPLDVPFVDLSDDGTSTVTITGTIEADIEYRDHKTLNSASVAVQPDIEGLPSIQMVELPTVALTGSNVWNHMSIKNPYNFAQIISIVIDGLQGDKFSTVDNITGYGLDAAENSASQLFRYENETMADYYHMVRETYAKDFKSGVFVFDAPTTNQEDVNNRLGKSYLNLASYAAARFGYKVKAIGESSAGASPRVVTFGVLLNEAGIRTV